MADHNGVDNCDLSNEELDRECRFCGKKRRDHQPATKWSGPYYCDQQSNRSFQRKCRDCPKKEKVSG